MKHDTSEMIRPGLERIALLLKDSHIPWQAIHVAGTNGKGSICAYIDAMLRAANVRTGRFNSPHLMDRWDCISINNTPIAESVFREAEDAVLRKNNDLNVLASSFEILTATAFEVFTRERIQLGIVECGMGGALDATNVIQRPVATVVASIGLDHQSWLGNTLEEIAVHKAGIAKRGSPMIVDGFKQASVLESIRKTAAQQGVTPLVVSNQSVSLEDLKSRLNDIGVTISSVVVPHQLQNMLVAYETLNACWEDLPQEVTRSTTPAQLASAMQSVVVPGRLQTIDLTPLVGSPTPALLDGAHNPESWTALAKFVNQLARSPNASTRTPVTWMLAATSGKPVDQMLQLLVEPEDNVVAVEFGPVDGMSWIKPTESQIIADQLEDTRNFTGITIAVGTDVAQGLKTVAQIAKGGPIVIAGSLYLVSHVSKLLHGKH